MTGAFTEAGSTLIMGVDPGSQHTGYGLVLASNHDLKLVAQGRISPSAAWPLARRLAHIHRELGEIAFSHRPQVVAVEDIFFGKNARSALMLGHVRGVVFLAATQAGAEVFEYAPRLVKNTVAGYGQAEKGQVARMVAELLEYRQPLAADAADALAVAICHASQCRVGHLLAHGGPSGTRARGGGWRNLSMEDLTALSYKRGLK